MFTLKTSPREGTSKERKGAARRGVG